MRCTTAFLTHLLECQVLPTLGFNTESLNTKRGTPLCRGTFNFNFITLTSTLSGHKSNWWRGIFSILVVLNEVRDRGGKILSSIDVVPVGNEQQSLAGNDARHTTRNHTARRGNEEDTKTIQLGSVRPLALSKQHTRFITATILRVSIKQTDFRIELPEIQLPYIATWHVLAIWVRSVP